VVPVLVIVVVGLLTTGVLVALVVGLLRNLRGLARSLRRFEEEVRPMAEGISADGLQAQMRLEGIRERLDRVPGARIRR
jgi:hypothetical protein